MTVGAVDSALQPTSFTSYGASIDIYANGFEIPGRVPGGRILNLSGTSMAAPQVTNLIGKLFSVRPELSVSDSRAAIEKAATHEGEKKLRVVHPAQTIERATK